MHFVNHSASYLDKEKQLSANQVALKVIGLDGSKAIASYSKQENEVIERDDCEYLKNGLFWNDLLLYS